MDRFKETSRIVFRFMLSGIFFVASGNHIFNHPKIVDRLKSAPLHDLATWAASPSLLVTLAGIGLFVGGLGLLSGLKTRWSAVLLIAIVLPITLIVQVGRVSTLGPLFKNIGLLGGLIYFTAHGAKNWSIDSYLNS